MKKQKNDNIILLKLALFVIIGALYFCAIWFLNRLIYKGALFFCPKGSINVALINASVIILSSFVITKNTIAWLKNNKRKTIIIITTFICCLLMPLLFLKSGTVGDEHSIKKINTFGNVTEEYIYNDITAIELSVRHGIQYDITFKSGEILSLASHEFLLNNFGNGENIVKFDKIISKYATKEIYRSIELYPANVRRFFTDKEAYKYFDDIIFREYY